MELTVTPKNILEEIRDDADAKAPLAGVKVRRAHVEGRRDWFERLFEFRECSGSIQQYEKTQSRFQYDPKSGLLTVKDVPPGLQFQAGTFHTPRLEELRAHAAATESEIQRILGDGELTVSEEVGDVAEMHTFAENRFALFQAASQFNALEHTSEWGIPENGFTCYSQDMTQGPACATACAPGLVVRNYFAFGPTEGQTTERQVLNLADVEKVLDNKEKEYFGVLSGYTISSDESLVALTEVLKDENLCEVIKSNLRIGVQQDTEVVASRFGGRRYEGAEPGMQLVTQAYCSAVSVSYSGCDALLWEPFARLILEAAYEATFHVAIENVLRHPEEPGARKVFLTALGGGVFGNEMSWIQDAMRKAFDKFKKLNLEVILVSYGEPTPEFESLLT